MANNAIANALNIRKIRNDDIVIAYVPREHVFLVADCPFTRFMGPTGSGKSHVRQSFIL
jgi:hypothetical protein